MLGQDFGEFHQALDTSHIAEIGIGKFVYDPGHVIDLVTHARLLWHQITLWVAG